MVTKQNKQYFSNMVHTKMNEILDRLHLIEKRVNDIEDYIKLQEGLKELGNDRIQDNNEVARESVSNGTKDNSIKQLLDKDYRKAFEGAFKE